MYWRKPFQIKFITLKKTTLLCFANGAKASIILYSLVLSIGLLSCNDPNTVGFEVQPESDHPNLTFSDTVTLQTEVYLADSAITYSLGVNTLSTALIGSMYDAEVGQSTANLYAQLNPSILSPDLDSASFDSLVLTFAYKSFYGDSTTQQTFTVYEMNESLSKDSTYYSNQTFVTKPTVIGTSTLSFSPNTSVILGVDTLAPHLRIKLDATFGQTLFDNIKGNNWLSSKETFLSNMKGVNVQCTGINSGGGIITYNPNTDFSGMTLYYTDTSSGSAQPKNIAFLMSDVARSNHFVHDYTLSAVGNIFPKPSPDKAYIQAMAGLRTKVTFPYLNSLKAIMPIAINKAELVVTLEPGSTSSLAASSSLNFARVDSAGNLLFTTDQITETANFGGTLSNNTYRFNIARYIQQLINGDITNDGFYLLPSFSGTSAYREVIGGGANASPSLKLKLQLTYTKLNP